MERSVTAAVAAVLLSAAAGGAAAGEWAEETSVFSNTSAVLAVDVVDGSHEYAVGMMDTGSSVGVVLQSSGSGSWSQVFQQNDTLIACVAFTDATTGFIGGLSMSGFNIQPFIKKTTSGGSSWTDTTIPGGWGDLVTDIAFAPGGDGFALLGSGVLLRSTDGGDSWSEVSLPVDGPAWNAVTFVDADTGWIVGAVAGEEEGDDDTWKDDGRGPPSQGTVLRTTDGGASWTAVTEGLAVDLQDAVLLTASRGIVVGYDEGGAVAYTTEDGGETLEPASLPTDGEGRGVDFLHGVSAPCGNQIWAVGAICTTTSCETGLTAILFSEDGGRSWSLDPWPQAFAESQWDLWQYHTLMDVDFAGPDRGIAGGTELSVLGYTGSGMECTPPEQDPLGDDDGGPAACDCEDDSETARRGTATSAALALAGLAALGLRLRQRRLP